MTIWTFWILFFCYTAFHILAYLFFVKYKCVNSIKYRLHTGLLLALLTPWTLISGTLFLNNSTLINYLPSNFVLLITSGYFVNEFIEPSFFSRNKEKVAVFLILNALYISTFCMFEAFTLINGLVEGFRGFSELTFYFELKYWILRNLFAFKHQYIYILIAAGIYFLVKRYFKQVNLSSFTEYMFRVYIGICLIGLLQLNTSVLHASSILFNFIIYDLAWVCLVVSISAIIMYFSKSNTPRFLSSNSL